MTACSKRSYEDIALDERATLSARITAEQVDRFAELTGDRNPLHMEEAFAMAQGHPGRVAHGLLVASHFSRLVGMQLPGERCLIHRTDLHYAKPTYVGDVLSFEVTVTQKIDAVRALVLQATARRGEDTVIRGKIQVGVLGGD